MSITNSKALALVFFCLLAAPLQAQVLQSGPVTNGHIASWATQGVIQDGGAVTANTFLAGGSITSISAGTTDYCSSAGCAASAAIAATVPFIGTAANLNFAVATAPGTGHTVTATLYTGVYGALTASAQTCQITGSATSCSDLTHQVNIPAGQAWAIQVVVGASATSTGGQTYGTQFISSVPPQPTSPYVLQSGQITSGHLAGWITNGVIGDGGSVLIGNSFVNDVLCANPNGQIVDCGQPGGTPLAPTATFGTNTTQLATTAFVQAALSGGTAGVFASIASGTNLPLLGTFVAGSTPALFWLNQSGAAASSTLPEIGGQFTMTSNVGLANHTTAYKIATTSSIIGGANSADIYGNNTLITGFFGSGGYLGVGVESDINNAGANAHTIGATTSSYGFVAAMSGTADNTAGVWVVSQGAAKWQYGNAVTGSIGDSDYYSGGTGLYGMHFAGTYNTAQILGIGWSVDNSGNISLGNLLPGSGNIIQWLNRSIIAAPADGIFELLNNAGTGFTRLQFGGTTSSFPALKRNGTALNSRLADDSADAPFTAGATTITGSFTATGLVTNADLANSTISGIALGSNLATLTFGTHLAAGGSSYNGSAGVTISTDATSLATVSTIMSRDVSGNTDVANLQASGTFFAPNITSDATQTDNTLCVVTSSGQFYKGSGTLGICLGTSSFASAKNSIASINDGMKRLTNLRPVNYFYRDGYGDNGARRQYGFIAEEYARVFPDLSRFDEAGNPTGVDMYGLVPVIVSALKEQQAEIETLKARIKP